MKAGEHRDAEGGELLLPLSDGDGPGEGGDCPNVSGLTGPGRAAPGGAPAGGASPPRDAAVLLASLPYVAGWTCSSILTLLYNKHLYRTGAFPYPLTLVLVHQAALGTLLWALRALAPGPVLKRVMPSASSVASHRDCAYAFLPIALLQAVAMASQNRALQLSSAHFVVMVNAVKPILVSLLQVAFGLITLNCVHLKIVSVISTGVLIAVAGEADMTLAGLCALMLAQMSEGVRVVLMQRSLSGAQELDAATLLSYSAPACALVLAPAALYFEVARMEAGTFADLGATMLGASIGLAVVVNVMSALVIQKTDALVLTFAGIIKDFIGIFVSAYCFAATVMPVQIFGYSIAVVFMNIYREFKRREAVMASDGLCSVLIGLVCPHGGAARSATAGPAAPEGDGGREACTHDSKGSYRMRRPAMYGLLLLLGVASACSLAVWSHSDYASELLLLVLGSKPAGSDFTGEDVVLRQGSA